MLFFCLGSSNNFGNGSENVDSISIVWFSHVDSTNDVVYNKRRES